MSGTWTRTSVFFSSTLYFVPHCFSFFTDRPDASSVPFLGFKALLYDLEKKRKFVKENRVSLYSKRFGKGLHAYLGVGATE